MLASTQMYIYMYVNTTLYRNSRISRLYCGKTIKDRGLLFGMVPTHILKAKTAKFQVLTPFGSLFFRYPIFKVYTIVYNSAGRFSTPLKTFSSRRVFRPFIEQGASPPPPGGVFFPGRACQRCNKDIQTTKISDIIIWQRFNCNVLNTQITRNRIKNWRIKYNSLIIK